jgi:hypothetical protein
MKLFFFFFIAVMSCLPGFAQQDSAGAVQESDSVVNKASLTLGTVYANNANYYGQKALETIPYAAVAATYKLKCGLYFTGMAYRLVHDTAHAVSAASAGAGINLKLSRCFSADISYSHTFFPSLSPLLQAANANNGTATLVYDNWLTSKVNVDYAFGETKDVFITAGTGKEITVGHITKKDVVTITPSVDVVGGTQHFYQTYITQKKLRDSLLGAVLGPLGGSNGNDDETKTTSATKMDLLSYNFRCPLAYNRARYLIELACQFSVLSSKVDNNAGKCNSFFTASFYYQF